MEGIQNISSDADKGRMMESSFKFKVVPPLSGLNRISFKFKTIKIALFLILFSLFPFHFSHFTFPLSPFTLHASEWKQATGERTWSFPADHGSHPEYRTEWWYFTGNLMDEAGSRYGYQLTFFRQGIENPTDGGSSLHKDNAWSVQDVYLAHFALTDVGKNRFWYIDRTSRTGPGLAHADTQGMDVHVLNWSARMNNKTIILNARHQGMEIKLELTPGKPVVLHGQKGMSIKGQKKGQSSYYYSFTDLKTSGSIKTPLNKETVTVKGMSWFDHEFGSNQLAPEQVGWDWFSIRLSDGSDLMVYFLRRKDGSIETSSSGTLIEKNGSSRHLELSDIKVDVLNRWKSPKSGGIYPGKWRMRIPSAHIDITITPSVANQELITETSAGITYWEGAVEGKGVSKNRPVTVEGYVELTGYTGSLGGIF